VKAMRRVLWGWMLGLCVAAAAGCAGDKHAPATTLPPAEGVPPADFSKEAGNQTPTVPTTGVIGAGYRYRIDMVSPPNDNNAITERAVYLYFWPDTTRVWFRLENRLGTPLKILWNDCRFTTADGQTFKTVHEGITYDRRYDPQDYTEVSGLQRYNGWIAPLDLLEDPRAAQGGGMRLLFPTDSSALSFLGKSFAIQFVLEIDGSSVSYPLVFKIDSVLPPP
jgi:hypothetical protein